MPAAATAQHHCEPRGRRRADQPDQAAEPTSSRTPREKKRRALREEAITELLNGKGKVEKRGASTVMKVSAASRPKSVDEHGKPSKPATSEDQYVELSREKTDKIFVVLADFGNERDPSFPDKDTRALDPGPTTFDGPLNNKIPQPDRTVDNSTVWQPNYDRAHFQDLYFGQGDAAGSGGARVGQAVLRAAVLRPLQHRRHGHDWVKVHYNEARYGRSATTRDQRRRPACAGHVCSNTWDLVRDAVKPVVRRPEGRRPHQRRHHGRAEDVRPVGPLRRRR